MTTGYVVFRLGERTFAAELDDVREIVRLDGLQSLPGAQPPLAGLLVVRGAPLPVFDVRSASAARGDVLVVAGSDGEEVGIAVDAVDAVLAPDRLSVTGDRPSALPAYVVGVCRGPDGPVLLVDLRRLAAGDAPPAPVRAASTARRR